MRPVRPVYQQVIDWLKICFILVSGLKCFVTNGQCWSVIDQPVGLTNGPGGFRERHLGQL